MLGTWCVSRRVLAFTMGICLVLAGVGLAGPCPAAGPGPALTLEQVVNGAVGPFARYCDGYGNPGASGLGYISLLKLEVGLSPADMDPVLAGIVSYDRAETRGTYIGQTNMITASSFNGLNGAVWGYHLAKADAIASGALKPLFQAKRPDGKQIPVYPMDPLLEAGRKLLGTAKARRFPLLPGAQVICAVKSHTVQGPGSVWCAAALALSQDRNLAANLFIEDVGQDAPPAGKARQAFVRRLQRHIVKSIMRCGQDSGVQFKEIFIGHKILEVPAGMVGCALTCAPYLVLAQKALPDPKNPARLLEMTLSQWEESLGLKGR